MADGDAPGSVRLSDAAAGQPHRAEPARTLEAAQGSRRGPEGSHRGSFARQQRAAAQLQQGWRTPKVRQA